MVKKSLTYLLRSNSCRGLLVDHCWGVMGRRRLLSTRSRGRRCNGDTPRMCKRGVARITTVNSDPSWARRGSSGMSHSWQAYLRRRRSWSRPRRHFDVWRLLSCDKHRLLQGRVAGHGGRYCGHIWDLDDPAVVLVPLHEGLTKPVEVKK